MEKNCFIRPPKDWTSKRSALQEATGSTTWEDKGSILWEPKRGTLWEAQKSWGFKCSVVFFEKIANLCAEGQREYLWDAKGSSFWEASLGFLEARKGKRIANWRDHPK